MLDYVDPDEFRCDWCGRTWVSHERSEHDNVCSECKQAEQEKLAELMDDNDLDGLPF